jgi:hypothetical protein
VLADANGEEVGALVVESAAQANGAEVRGTPTLAIQVGDGEPTALEPGVGLSDLTAALDDALGS